MGNITKLSQDIINERVNLYKQCKLLVNLDSDGKLIQYLTDNGFFLKPASRTYHGNYTGGLFDHSFKVMNVLLDMTESLDIKWQRPESPYIVGMFHDLCKMDDYVDENATDVVMMGTGTAITNDPEWVQNPDSILTGHGDKSVIMLSQFITLTEEEILCIRFHMGAYQTADWDAYDAAIKKYDTVLWTHTADMYASKVLGV